LGLVGDASGVRKNIGQTLDFFNCIVSSIVAFY